MKEIERGFLIRAEWTMGVIEIAMYIGWSTN